MRALRHALAVCLLPGTVVVLVPLLILRATGSVSIGWGLPGFLSVLPVVVGVALLSLGGVLVVWTITLFVRVGEGTLAPWAPTSTLVVRGPYRHVRNPMISGVLFLLLGQAALLGSWALLVWFAGVAALNVVYIPVVEEPGLVGRYGADYERYREGVPRWLPRIRPWDAAQPPP